MVHRITAHIHRHVSFLIGLVLLAALLVGCLMLLGRTLTPVTADYDEIWAADDELGAWEVYVVENGTRRNLDYEGNGWFSGLARQDQTFFASCRLDQNYEGALLEINSGYGTAVFLDDDLLYAEEGLPSGIDMNDLQMSGEPSLNLMPAVVSLPSDYTGKELTIAQAQGYNESASASEDDALPEVFFGPITLFGSAYYRTEISADALRSAYPAELYLILAVILAGLFLAGLYDKAPAWSMLWLCLFLLSWMAYTYASSSVFSAYFSDFGSIASVLYDGGYVLLLLFLASGMERFRFTAYMIAAAEGAAVVLSILGTNVLPYGDLSVFLMLLPYLITPYALAGIVILAIIEAVRRNTFYVWFVRLLLAGLILFAVILLVSAMRNGSFAEDFRLQLSITLQDGGLSYFANLLRYILVAASFLCAVLDFFAGMAERRAEHLLAAERAQMAEQSYAEIQRSFESNARLRHDFGRHLSMLGQFLTTGDTGRAERYLEELGIEMSQMPSVISTGNFTADVILNAKISEARASDIAVEASGGTLPSSLPLSDRELSSLLLNLLDNAIRAASQSQEKKLFVRIYQRSGFFCMICENTMPEIPKSQDDRRRWGLSIVQMIVEKHDGLVEIEHQQGSWWIQIVIPLGTDPPASDDSSR